MLGPSCSLDAELGRRSQRWTYRDAVIPIALGALLALLVIGAKAHLLGVGGITESLGGQGSLYLVCAKLRARLASGIGMMFLAGMLYGPSPGGVLLAERTFCGVLRVRVDSAGQYHSLFHGSTSHGEQALDAARRHEPRTYYHRMGPIGQ